jgi:hypothetical protein
MKFRAMLIGLMVMGAHLTNAVTAQAQAQIGIQVDIDGVICGLLPIELRDVCVGQSYVSGDDESIVEFCENLMFKDNKRACRKSIHRRYFSTDAMNFCKSFVVSDTKLGCLKDIADVRYFQPEALTACSKLAFTKNKLECISTFRNAYIHPADIDSCRSAVMSDEKLACLKGFAQKVDYPKVIPPPKKRRGIFW